MSRRSPALQLSVNVDPRVQVLPRSGSELLAESTAGDPVVYGWYDPPRGEVAVEQLARYLFADDSEAVDAHLYDGASRQDVVHTFYTTALPLIAWACDGLEAFHASGVRSTNGVVALCGPSGSGKSTLAFALAARGYGQFAEDAVAFDAHDGVRAVPLPFTTKLRAPTSDHFLRSISAQSSLGEVQPAAGPETPFTALILLDPVDDGAPLAVRLSPSEAMVELLPNAHRFRDQPAGRERQMLGAYLSLVAETPVYRLTFPHRFEQLDSVLDEIEATLAR